MAHPLAPYAVVTEVQLLEGNISFQGLGEWLHSQVVQATATKAQLSKAGVREGFVHMDNGFVSIQLNFIDCDLKAGNPKDIFSM